MTICVVGPGLVGCFLGAIAGAKRWHGGSRGPRAMGVRFQNQTYQWNPEACSDVREERHLVTTRAPDTPWENLEAEALVIQNGLGQPRPVGVALLAVDCDEHGQVYATGDCAQLTLPKPSSFWQPAIDAWRAAGIRVDCIADTRPAQWEKAILNATVGPLCLAENATMDAVWRQHQELVLAATREGLAVAQAQHIDCDPQLEQRAVDFFTAVGQHRPSILDDPRELGWIFPPILGAAESLGISCPNLSHIYQQALAAIGAGRGVA